MAPALVFSSVIRLLVILLAATVIVLGQWRHFGESASTVPSMATQMLRAHNAIRAKVGAQPLVWSPELAQYAKDWAGRLAKEDALFHHPSPEYGENLYLVDGALSSPAAVVAAWAAEASNYDYRSNSCRRRCGHYTQIVWKATTAVGCAQARQGRTQVWVCEYNPPGNIEGERPY